MNAVGTAVTSDRTVSMPFAGKQGRARGGPAEAHGPAVDAPERFARAQRVGPFSGRLGSSQMRCTPSTSAIIAGDGGDQRRHSVDAIIAPMDQIGMEPQGREAAMADGAGVQVGFRMGAIDGPAAPPEAACCFRSRTWSPPLAGANAGQ